MVEGEKLVRSIDGTVGAGGIKCSGTEGLFAAIEARGNVYSGFWSCCSWTGALGDLMNT